MANGSVRRRVLVVDDHSILREIYQSILEMNGLEVLTAEDGEDALGKLKSFRPDLVLLDMNMPKLDGLGFLDRLDSESYDRRPVVVAASADAGFMELSLQKGATEFLQKPMELDVLIKVVDSVLAGRKPEDSLQVTNLSRIQDKFSLEDRQRDEILSSSRLSDAEFRRQLRNALRWLTQYFGTPLSFLNLLRNNKLVLFENVGIPEGRDPGPTLPCESTYCANLIRVNESLVIRDSLLHQVYSHHPVTKLGIRFYVSVPLQTPVHVSLGTLCIESFQPEEFHVEDLSALTFLADKIGTEIFLSSRGNGSWTFFPDQEFLPVDTFIAFKKARVQRKAGEPFTGLSLKRRDPVLSSGRADLARVLKALPKKTGVAFSEIQGSGTFSGFGPASALEFISSQMDRKLWDVLGLHVGGADPS